MPDVAPQPLHNRRKYDGFTLEQKVDETLALVESLMAAFPDGPLKHREAHEMWMQAKQAETRFWAEMRLDLAKKGAWGLIAILAGLIIAGFSTKVALWLR